MVERKDMKAIAAELAAPFADEDIEWLEEDNGKVLAYADARVREDRLDEVVGVGNWSCKVLVQNGCVVSTVSILIDGEWVSKDSIGERDYNSTSMCAKEAQAFKRACSKWGVGRFFIRYGLYERCAMHPRTTYHSQYTRARLVRLRGGRDVGHKEGETLHRR